jgi:glycosyltransferase involved in cell wall biosynthesis
VEELIRALRALDHQVVVVGPPRVEEAEFGSAGGLFAKLKTMTPPGLYEFAEFSYSLVAFAKLVLATLRHRPDCLYERYNLYLPAGVWLKRCFALPMLLEVNAPLFAERERYGGLANRRLAAWSEGFTWRGADRVLAVTRVLGDRIRAAGVEQSRIQIVPNAVNPEHFALSRSADDAKRRLNLQGRFVLGFVGFVREWHGLDRIVEIMARLRRDNLHLLVVGDGPARDDLEHRAENLGLRNQVTITGVVARDDVVDYISAFDIALQPRVVEYASPLKILEYLALGRAIVAPATANMRELLDNGKNALLFDPDDDDALQDAIERLYDDSSLRATISSAALETISSKGISWRANAKRVVSSFHELGVRDKP